MILPLQTLNSCFGMRIGRAFLEMYEDAGDDDFTDIQVPEDSPEENDQNTLKDSCSRRIGSMLTTKSFRLVVFHMDPMLVSVPDTDSDDMVKK